MSHLPRLSRKSLIAFAAGCLLMLATAAWQGRSVAIDQPPLERLNCVSFAHPETVLIIGKRPPPEQADIERELTELAKWTSCIRVYSSDPRQEYVIPFAEKQGLKVILGAWINSHPDTSHAEMDRAIALAEKYPGTVKALLMGNEVLTVKEMPLAELTPYLDEARKRSPVPVSVAEVWSIWLDQPELAEHVDFIAAHILPYWDDFPISLNKAFGFIETSLTKLETRFPGKPILIAETGWPSGGRAKGGFPPGQVEQSRFVRAIAGLAERHHWDYNLVESFDQPWKRYSEGVAGGTWGLFDKDGEPKFSFDGPAIPDKRWWIPALGALLLGGLALLACRPRTMTQAALAPIFGGLWVWQATFLYDWYSGWVRAGLALVLLAGSAAIAIAALRRETVEARPAQELLALWKRPLCLLKAAFGSAGGLLTLYQLDALYLCLEEPFQIPADYYTLVFAIPALTALLLTRCPKTVWNRRLGWALPAGGLLCVGLSLLVVPQAWAWAGITLLLAKPLLRAKA